MDDEIDLLLEGLIADRIGYSIDKQLVWLDKPLNKLRGDEISVFHGSKEVMRGTLQPRGVNVGATKFSSPRWSTYYWDNMDSAIRWALLCSMCEDYRCVMSGEHSKLILSRPKDVYDDSRDDELINDIVERNMITYVYEAKVNIHDLEVGSVPSINEYTVSKPLKIYKTHKIMINRDIIRKYFKIINYDDYITFRRNLIEKGATKSRNKMLNMILDNRRDWLGRGVVNKEIRAGNVKIGDDITRFKKDINKMAKKDPRDVYPNKYKK